MEKELEMVFNVKKETTAAAAIKDDLNHEAATGRADKVSKREKEETDNSVMSEANEQVSMNSVIMMADEDIRAIKVLGSRKRWIC